MSDGGNRMVEYHSRPRPPHDYSYAFLHVGSVTVDGTFLACRFLLAVSASVQSAVGIVEQLLTFPAQAAVAFLLVAIETYHLLYHRFFFVYSFVHVLCLFNFPLLDYGSMVFLSVTYMPTSMHAAPIRK